MKVIRDTKHRCIAMLSDGPYEMAHAGYSARSHHTFTPSENWNGRTFNDWAGFLEAFHKPWAWGVQEMNRFLTQLRETDLPTPKDRRRKPRWSDTEGECEVDRLMDGEPEYNREVRRRRTHGPAGVALLCNLDANCGNTPQKVFWRSAAAVAAVDLIESYGYMAEVWMWNRGSHVYKAPWREQFNACCVKAAGAPLDVDAMLCGLSAWFLRSGIFGSYYSLPERRGTGGPVYELGHCREYLEIDESLLEVEMPVAFTQEKATEGAKFVLNKIIEAHT